MTIAKARAIAAKLSAVAAPIHIDSDLGKRKNRWDQDSGLSAYGPGCKLFIILVLFLTCAKWE